MILIAYCDYFYWTGRAVFGNFAGRKYQLKNDAAFYKIEFIQPKVTLRLRLNNTTLNKAISFTLLNICKCT